MLPAGVRNARAGRVRMGDPFGGTRCMRGLRDRGPRSGSGGGQSRTPGHAGVAARVAATRLSWTGLLRPAIANDAEPGAEARGAPRARPGSAGLIRQARLSRRASCRVRAVCDLPVPFRHLSPPARLLAETPVRPGSDLAQGPRQYLVRVQLSGRSLNVTRPGRVPGGQCRSIVDRPPHSSFRGGDLPWPRAA